MTYNVSSGTLSLYTTTTSGVTICQPAKSIQARNLVSNCPHCPYYYYYYY